MAKSSKQLTYTDWMLCKEIVKNFRISHDKIISKSDKILLENLENKLEIQMKKAKAKESK